MKHFTHASYLPRDWFCMPGAAFDGAERQAGRTLEGMHRGSHLGRVAERCACAVSLQVVNTSCFDVCGHECRVYQLSLRVAIWSRQRGASSIVKNGAASKSHRR